MGRFAAIDFETATSSRDSACSLGLVVVDDGRIEVSRTYLIRPPAPDFSFTGVHGLNWEDVRGAPSFGELWPTLHPRLESVEFIAAHNAPFDRSVLRACCARYGVAVSRKPFVCTVQLARSQWEIYPTTLPDVCRELRIPLSHHESGSDAEACARIILAAEAAGWSRQGPRRRRTRLPGSRRNR